MPFDSLVLRSLEGELTQLVDSRVLKIHQPSRLEIILTLRKEGENLRLLLSAHPQHARVHLTTQPRTNPTEPPMFCMYLRRHLEGTRLRHVRRPEGERILGLVFQGRDELGNPTELELIAEIMGKHSNLILINRAQRTILAAAKHVTSAVNRYREVLPGLTYREPPAQNKIQLADLTELSFYSLLQAQRKGVASALVGTVAGLSPLIAREIAVQANLEENFPTRELVRPELFRLWKALDELRQLLHAGHFIPTLYREQDGRVKEVTAFPLQLFSAYPRESFASMSAALDVFFREKEANEQVNTTRHDLLTVLRHAEERTRKRLALHLSAVTEAGEAQRFRRYGELLFAHAYHLPQTAAEVKVEDWENPGQHIRIPLEPNLSLNQNAQQYFRRFTKAKKTLAAAREQLEKDQEELAYLDSVSLALEDAKTLAELGEIRRELEKGGYIKPQDQVKTTYTKKDPPSSPLEFRSSQGWTILVGRNNRQNDRLTLRAEPHDLWLHAQNIPGSHVVIRCPKGQEPPEETILEAALLAAYHSKSRFSSRVPVDYTFCRNVRKPRGAKPGFVVYEQQRTIYVTPDPEKVEALRRSGS
ncbi:MAG: Rqc2 family fibronectin-binding protein [bacterium]|jgi:predicted ribosome quality control (RQC) complex YloA/Tae2 family protein